MTPLTLDDLRKAPIFFYSHLYDYDELKDELVAFYREHGSLPKYSEPAGLLSFLVEIGLAQTNSEARRFVQGNAVELDGVKITDFHTIVVPYPDLVVRVGKRRYMKIKIT